MNTMDTDGEATLCRCRCRWGQYDEDDDIIIWTEIEVEDDTEIWNYRFAGNKPTAQTIDMSVNIDEYSSNKFSVYQ